MTVMANLRSIEIDNQSVLSRFRDSKRYRLITTSDLVAGQKIQRVLVPFPGPDANISLWSMVRLTLVIQSVHEGIVMCTPLQPLQRALMSFNSTFLTKRYVRIDSNDPALLTALFLIRT